MPELDGNQTWLGMPTVWCGNRVSPIELSGSCHYDSSSSRWVSTKVTG